MNLFRQIKSWAANAVLRAGQPFSWLPEWIKTAWMDTDFRTLMQSGYKASSAVANCVRALAFSFPEAPMIAYKKTNDGEVPADPDDPLQALIRKPNPDMGEAEFMQFVITYASTGGNVYIWKERSNNGKVLYLWPFSDHDIAPVPGHNILEGVVAGYEFDPGDGEKIYLSKNDVIQWKWMIDPEQPWRGIGAIEFAARDVTSDTESSRYMYSMFKNNAVPPVVITMTEGDEVSDERVEALQAMWKKRYGNRNQGVPGFLDYGMTVQKLGLNMQELNLSELKNVPESRICGAFGVPPSIAMLYVGLKRSDYGDGMARKSFTETTLVALWRTFASEMTASLSDEFGGGYTLKYDLNQVKALQENVNELWTRLSSATDKGLITRADFKRGVGLKAGAEDNVYRTNLIYGWEPAGTKAALAKPQSTQSNSDVSKSHSEKSLDDATHEQNAKNASGAVYGRALQRIRLSMWSSMTEDLDGYFSSLADRIVSRAGKSLQVMGEAKSTKKIPDIDELLSSKDEAELEKLLKRWFAAIAEASWETINLSVGVTIAFDLADPAVMMMLAMAGGQVKEITATTRMALQEALQYGSDQGWSIGQLVRGDETQPGLRSIIEETYKGRAKTIARTELGNAQNTVTAERYGANGIALVGILDNGETDDDEPCKVADGQVWTLEYFKAHPLEHPNCTRVAYPIFEDSEPDRS